MSNEEIVWQTDYDARPKYSVIVGVQGPRGERAAAYEIGVWRDKKKAQAYARHIIGHALDELSEDDGLKIDRYDWDDSWMNEDCIVLGTTVEEFTDAFGTERGWDYDLRDGEIVVNSFENFTRRQELIH